jgi:hypothetical protein
VYKRQNEVHTEETTSGTKTKTITKKIIPNAADIAIVLNNLDPDFDSNEIRSHQTETIDFEYEEVKS